MKGQTLIEVVVALGIGAIVLYAISTTVISSLNNAQFSKDQNLATQYAQQGVEVLKQMKDTNLSGFLGLNRVNYCMDENNVLTEKSLNCEQNLRSYYVREARIEGDSTNCPGSTPKGTWVSVSVSWNDSKCTRSPLFCHSTQAESCFYNINPTPLP